MAFASGAVSALRPAARAWSSSLRTAGRSCGGGRAPLVVTRPTALSCDTSNHLFGAQRRNFFGGEAKLGQHLIGVLPEQRRALDLGGAVGHLDRVADRQVFAAGRMIHLDDGAAGAQRGFGSQFLHRQDRTARNVVLVELGHGFEFGFGHGPAFDRGEDLHQARQARVRRRVVGIGDPLRLADDVADFLPHRRLGDEVEIRVRVGFPALALDDPAGLATARGVARARYRGAELALGELRVFLHDLGAGQALLVAQLDATQVQYPVLHRRQHALAAAAGLALVQGADDAKRQVQAGAAVADLGAGDQWRTVVEAGGGGGSAGALRDVLIHLAVLVRSGAEALDRGDDHHRVELLDALPGEAHAIECAGREVFHQHIAVLDEFFQNRLAALVLGVERDRTLVVVQHREVQAVHVRNVAQLLARDVAVAGALHFDDIGAEPGQQLRAGRTRLHVREVEYAHAVQCFRHLQSPCLSHLYMVWFLVPGAYSRGSTQMLITAERRRRCTDSRARSRAGAICAGSRTSSP